MKGHIMRRGFILIVVIGVCALLSSLALAFVLVVRTDSSISEQVVKDYQMRIMLHAGCAFILESARMGYGPDPALGPPSLTNGLVADNSIYNGSTPKTGLYRHREGFGWIDVRTNNLPNASGGSNVVGPLDQNYVPVYTGSKWPAVQGVAICPMYVWKHTRYAISPRVNYNPIESDPTIVGRYGYPFLNVPDPQPSAMNVGLLSQASNSDGTLNDGGLLNNAGQLNAMFSQYAYMPNENSPSGAGIGQVDNSPVQNSQGMGWFRVFRKSAATFIVVCGSGGGMGFKSYDEALAPPGNIYIDRNISPPYSGYFANSRDLFNVLRQAESMTFYEVRWSASVKIYTNTDFMNAFSTNSIRHSNAIRLLTPYWSSPPYEYDCLPGLFIPYATPDLPAITALWSSCFASYLWSPVNQSPLVYQQKTNMAQPYMPNQLGTISYIQRLSAGVDAVGNVGYIQPTDGPSGANTLHTDW